MSSNTAVPVIATTVPEKARKEIADVSRDKLRGAVVQHFVTLFAPFVSSARVGAPVRVRPSGHGPKKAVKKKAAKKKK